MRKYFMVMLLCEAIMVCALLLVIFNIHKRNNELENLVTKAGISTRADSGGSDSATSDTAQSVSGQSAPSDGGGEKTVVDEIDELKSRLDEAIEKKESYEATIRQLQAQVEEAQTRQAAGAGSSGSAPGMSSADMADMMKSPSMKAMINAQQKALVEDSNKSLFEYLDLPAEDQKALMDILVDKQQTLVATGLEAAGLSPEEAQELFANLPNYDSKIKDLLGDEKYETYQTFQETQPERMQLDAFKQSLGADAAMDDTQMESLMLAMYEIRRDDFPTQSYQQNSFLPGGSSPADWNDEVVAQHLEKLSNLHQEFLTSAQGILTEPQMEIFANSLKQEFARQKMVIDSARMFFGVNSK